jgi:hypothetical protein
MLFCLIVAILIVVGVGLLHSFYESSYQPINNNGTSMTPVPMPIEGQPSNINHHMYIFLNHNVSATTRKYFGTLPEENQSTGYLAAAD